MSFDGLSGSIRRAEAKVFQRQRDHDPGMTSHDPAASDVTQPKTARIQACTGTQTCTSTSYYKVLSKLLTRSCSTSCSTHRHANKQLCLPCHDLSVGKGNRLTFRGGITFSVSHTDRRTHAHRHRHTHIHSHYVSHCETVWYQSAPESLTVTADKGLPCSNHSRKPTLCL